MVRIPQGYGYDEPVPAPGESPSSRLSLDVIVDAAAKLVAEDGFEALSMRRLAKECGVGAMTLYGYVRTKDEVLQALANRIFSTLELPGDDTESWQERVRQVVGSLRTVFLAHPELLPIVATQRLDGVAAYRGAEALFGALDAAGLQGEQLIHAFYALASFTIGSVQREVGLQNSDAGEFPGLRSLAREEFPQVIDLAGHLVTADPEATFRAGLELLIAGIATTASS